MIIKWYKNFENNLVTWGHNIIQNKNIGNNQVSDIGKETSDTCTLHAYLLKAWYLLFVDILLVYINIYTFCISAYDHNT